MSKKVGNRQLGKTVSLAGGEVIRRLQILGITPERFLISIPEEIKIKRLFQILTARQIEAGVTREFLPILPWDEVRLGKIDIREDVELPVGNVSLTFESSARTDLCRPFYLCVNFWVNNTVVKRSFFRTTLAIHHKVAVAEKELIPTQKVGESDVRWEKRRLASTLHPPISIQFLENKRPRWPIASGSILTQDLFLTVPLVKRGEKVLLVFQHESMSVTTQGKALTSGSKGDRIQAMNIDSRKTILAEILDEKTARVIF